MADPAAPAFDGDRHFLVMKQRSAARMREAFGKDLTLRALTRLLLGALRTARPVGRLRRPGGTARRYGVYFEAFGEEALVELTEAAGESGRPRVGPDGMKALLFVTLVAFPARPGGRGAA
jgi:hypothetical protein